MYCPNCDLAVETEVGRKSEREAVERFLHYFDADDVRGGYDPSAVGETFEQGGDVWQVRLRTDACANCGEYLDARTYAQK